MSSSHVSRLTYTHVTGFATAAPGAAPANGWRLLLTDGPPTKTKKQNTDGAQESNFLGSSSRDWATNKKAELSFKTRVFGGTTSFDGAGTDVDPTSCFSKKLLEDYHGAAASSSTTTTVGAVSGPGKTTSLVVVASAGFLVGQGILVGAVGGSAAEFAVITSIPDATHLVLDHDLAAANYVSGSIIYGCWNLFPTLATLTDFLYLNNEVDGNADLLGAGSMFGLKVTGLSAGDGARYEWDFEGDTWNESGPTPSTVVDGYSTNNILVSKGSPVSLDNTEEMVAECTFNPGLKKAWLRATSGVEGRGGVAVVARDNPTVELTEYYNANRWTKYKNRDPFPFRGIFYGGAASTNVQKARAALGIFMPACEVVDLVEVSLDGVRAQKVTLKGIDPAFASSGYLFSSLTRPYSMHVFGG